MWYGVGSTDAERTAALQYARSIAEDPDNVAELAEGEEDEGGEDAGDTEDQEIYCYCQKLSYGEVRPLFRHPRAVWLRRAGL